MALRALSVKRSFIDKPLFVLWVHCTLRRPAKGSKEGGAPSVFLPRFPAVPQKNIFLVFFLQFAKVMLQYSRNLKKEVEPMFVITDACISCGTCAENCPVEAISEGADHYEINQDTCVACGACAGNCPVEAIEEQ